MDGKTQVDAYLAAVPEDQRAALVALRGVLRGLLPDAQEVISYAMPGFRKGKMVAGYAAFAKHCGFYPHSGTVIGGFAAEIEALGFKYSKSGITFPASRPLPHDLVARIVAKRLEDIAQ